MDADGTLKYLKRKMKENKSIIAIECDSIHLG
jgi:hypothetical protein